MLSSSLTLLHQHAGMKSSSSLSQEPAGRAGGTVGTRSLAPRPSTRGGPCQGRRKEQVTCTGVCYKTLQMFCVLFPMLCCYVELLPVNIHKANLVAFTRPLFTCFDPTVACSCATKPVHPTDQHFLMLSFLVYQSSSLSQCCTTQGPVQHLQTVTVSSWCQRSHSFILGYESTARSLFTHLSQSWAQINQDVHKKSNISFGSWWYLEKGTTK